MKFYTVEPAPNKRIRYYAERGLLAYLFHELRDDPVPMLEAAKSRDGAALASAIDIGELRGWRRPCLKVSVAFSYCPCRANTMPKPL